MPDNNQSRKTSGHSGLLLALGAAIGAGSVLLGNYLFNNNQEQQSHSYGNRTTNYNRSHSVPIRPTNLCVICQELIEPPLEQLPCDHLFHQKCLLKALRIRQICPICKTPISNAQMKIYIDRENE